MPKKPVQTDPRLANGCMALFTSIFFFVGIGLLWGLGIRPLLQVNASQSWNEVNCVVNRIGIKTHSGDGTTYSAEVQYTYAIDDQPIVGDRFWFSSGSISSRRSIEKAVKRFEQGGEYICYVNPKDPKDSVLLREQGPMTWLGWLIGGLFTIVGGVTSASLFAAFLKSKPTPKKIVVERPSRAPLLDRSSETKRSHLGDDFSGVMVYECDVVPNEPESSDEPIVLTTPGSRIASAVAIGFFALLWNSITWTMTYFAVQEVHWFAILFMGLFNIVGVATIVGTVYATLQIFNPRPTLVCSQNRLYPGTEFEISWTHRGNTGRISELHIILVGTEEVSFRQGTSNRTERNVFHQQTIVKTQEKAEINEGFRLLTLGNNSMHSFKSARNSISWMLKVHGKIAWWPDVSDEFPITIYPPLLPIDRGE